MGKRKYKKGKPIRCFAMFEESNCRFFIVTYGGDLKGKTTHRAFLESWQYHTLDVFMQRGWIYETVRIEDEQLPEHSEGNGNRSEKQKISAGDQSETE